MKTTLTGIFAAVAYAFQDVFQHGAQVTDWKTWIVPFAISALGYFAKDHTSPTTPQ